jgi:hypothetical protein
MHAAFATLALVGWAAAAEFSPKITDLTVFKDGHVLVMARGEADLKDGWCRTREVPVPVLGTFWSFVERDGAQIDFVKAGMVEATETRPCLTFEEILKANVGKQVTITEQSKEGPAVVHSGKLRGILEHKADRESDVSHTTPVTYDRWSGRRTGGNTIRETRTAEATSMASFVMIETGKGVELIQRADIRGISLADKNPATTHTETKEVREIAVHATAKGKPLSGKAPVGMVYLQKGVRWIPSYRVELLEDGKARVSLRGTIINDLADFENAHLRLVVGVPSFIMKDTLSPVALREANLYLSSYFRPPSRSGTGAQFNYLSNAMMSQVAAPVAQRGGPQPAGGPDIPAEGQMEDLFLYDKTGVSLKKGERAVVHLLDVTVPYEDVYVWEVPFVPPRELWRHVGSNERNQLARRLTGAKAMHKVRLTNTGKTPWTTGPATVFRGYTPLGQQLMTFTSIQNKVDLPITIAVDLNTKKEETEVNRERKALRVNGHDYSKITVKGKLTLTNFKTKPVKLSVQRQVVGAVTEANLDAKILRSNTAEGAGLTFEDYYWWRWGWPWWWLHLNPLTEVNWETTVPAGKAATFEYTYYYYHYQ